MPAYGFGGGGVTSNNGVGTSGILPDGSLRVSNPSLIFDGKTIMNQGDAIWSRETVGTGAFSFITNNQTEMTVAADGDAVVMQSRITPPYFSGFPINPEQTFRNFAPQAGVVKRFGSFSTNLVSPWDTNVDGWYFESNTTDTVVLKVFNNGTETLNLPISQWNNQGMLPTDFNKFQVVSQYFLWLGGAGLDTYWAMGDKGFVNTSRLNWSGTVGNDTLTAVPAHPIRYEIRSTGGAGTFNPICSQISVDGPVGGGGRITGIFTQDQINATPNNGTYLVLGARLNSSNLEIAHRIVDAGSVIQGNDSGVVGIYRNPTFTGGTFTWTDGNTEGTYEQGQPTGGSLITMTDPGDRIVVFPAGRFGTDKGLDVNYASWMGYDLNGNVDEYFVGITTDTNGVNVRGTMDIESH